MNHKNSISVIIPTFNRASTICRTIRSALVQIGIHDEIIVIDDCSEDNTKQVLEPFIKRIKYIQLPSNQGFMQARNAAIKLSQTDFCSFLDSDDIYLKHAISTIKRSIRSSSADILQFTIKSNIKKNGSFYRGYNPQGGWKTHRPEYWEIVTKHNIYLDMHRVIKTAVAKKNLFAQNNPGFETGHYSMLSKLGYKFQFFNIPVVKISETSNERHSISRHKKWPNQYASIYKHFLRDHDRILKQFPKIKSRYELLIAKCSLHTHNPKSLYWILRAIKTNPAIVINKINSLWNSFQKTTDKAIPKKQPNLIL